MRLSTGQELPCQIRPESRLLASPLTIAHAVTRSLSRARRIADAESSTIARAFLSAQSTQQVAPEFPGACCSERACETRQAHHHWCGTDPSRRVRRWAL
jgi:hypothetical protein